MRSKWNDESLRDVYNTWHFSKFLVGSTSKGALTIGGTRIINFPEFVQRVESMRMGQGWRSKKLKFDFYQNFYLIREDGSLQNVHHILRMMFKQGLIVSYPTKGVNYRGDEVDIVCPRFSM